MSGFDQYQHFFWMAGTWGAIITFAFGAYRWGLKPFMTDMENFRMFMTLQEKDRTMRDKQIDNMKQTFDREIEYIKTSEIGSVKVGIENIQGTLSKLEENDRRIHERLDQMQNDQKKFETDMQVKWAKIQTRLEDRECRGMTDSERDKIARLKNNS